jgi:hypothetical protein
MLDKIKALKAPPFAEEYQRLEVQFFEAYVAAVSAALVEDRITAGAYFQEMDKIWAKLGAEIEAGRTRCGQTDSESST